MMGTSQQVALECAGLSIGYVLKGGAKRVVASGLDLTLRAGEFVCLLGPNGAGKSTLIRALSGLEKPLAGSVNVEGEDLGGLSPRERALRIGVVLTESMPMGMFAAEAVVALGRHPHTRWTGRLTARDRERVAWALEAVGASGLKGRMVGELSDGERQKIMIARALAQESRILFLDEPTAYLDLPRRVELMQTLRELARKEGLSIALSTHDLDLALRCADTLWLLSDSGELATGMPESLALDGTIARVFASSNLDWDAEHGSFRMHRASCVGVWIEGSGAGKAWTRRALMRIGYGMSPTPERAQLLVTVAEREGGWAWRVIGRGEERSFDSIAALVDALKGQKTW